MRPTPFAARLLAALLAALPAAALAQSSGGGAEAPAEAPVPDVDEAELDAVVGAMIDVRAIAEEASPAVEAAETDAAREEIVRDARERMVEAVQAQGLSIETYNAVLAAAREDEGLAARLGERLEAREGG